MKIFLEVVNKKLSVAGASLSVGALWLSIILVLVGVAARYIFRIGVVFIDEYIGYLLIVITFMGLAYTFNEGGHIKVDLIFRLLPRKAQLIVRLVTSLVALSISTLLTVETYKRVLVSYKYNVVSVTPMETPLFIPQMFIPLAFGLLSLAVLNFIVKLFVHNRKDNNGH